MKRVILICILYMFSYIVNAQISTEELPVSFQESITESYNPSYTLSSLNMNTIEQEDIADEANGLPPRFGYPHAVNYNLNNSGVWTVLPNGDKIWMLHIKCPGALSINLLYDQFWLPEGAKLFVYSSDKNHVTGAFTSVNNKGTQTNPQGFATGLIYSDQITVEYYLPQELTVNGIISIAYIVQGYRYIQIPGFSTESFGGSGNCQVNVNCSEGANWQNEKNAVAMILVNGNRYCTGSLINTTANDFQPLFLTADHCLGGWANSVKHDAINAPNLSHWSFYWHYESPGCSNTSDPPAKSTVGATVVANNSASDFALLQLMENPLNKQGVTTYYLGWDHSGNAGTGGVGIHHPSGDVKKISSTNQIQNQSTQITESGVIWAQPNTHWKVVWNSGSTEGGSSGSPLINNNHHVIGQLHGGSASCNSLSSPDYYGKFSVSWNGGGTSTTRLKDWLDPNNTNVTTINGSNYQCNTIYINNQTYSSGTQTVSGCKIEISNTTINSGATVNIISQQGVTLKPGFWAKSGSTVSIKATQAPSSGLLSAQAMEVENDANSLTLLEQAVASQKTGSIDFTVYPNPNDGNFTVKIIGTLQAYTVEIFNASGGILGNVNCNAETVSINRSDLPSGIYYLKLSTDSESAVKKLIVK